MAAAKKNNNSMKPGSRMVTGKAIKAGVKKMDVAKATAASRSDAAKFIGYSNPRNTKASLANAIKDYRSMLAQASKTNKKVQGMTKNQISNALDQLLEQRNRMK